MADFKTKLTILQESGAKLKKALHGAKGPAPPNEPTKTAAVIFNNLINLLDDKQQLILHETLALLITFSHITESWHIPLASAKVRLLASKLLERCKETKKVVI